MKTKSRALIFLAFLAVLGAGGARSDYPAKLKAVVQRYMEMQGEPLPGVVMEMAEFVDKERTLVTMAETEIINGLRQAGIPVLEKGKPEFLVYGAVESNWSGQQNAFGAEVFVYEAAITLKLIDVRKGEVMDTASAQVRKVNPGRERAARDAIKEAGSAAAKKIVGILKPGPKTE